MPGTGSTARTWTCASGSVEPGSGSGISRRPGPRTSRVHRATSGCRIASLGPRQRRTKRQVRAAILDSHQLFFREHLAAAGVGTDTCRGGTHVHDGARAPADSRPRETRGEPARSIRDTPGDHLAGHLQRFAVARRVPGVARDPGPGRLRAPGAGQCLPRRHLGTAHRPRSTRAEDDPPRFRNESWATRPPTTGTSWPRGVAWCCCSTRTRSSTRASCRPLWASWRERPDVGSVQGRLRPLDASGARCDTLDTTGLLMQRDRRAVSRDQGGSTVRAQGRSGPVWGVDGPAPVYRRRALLDARAAVFDRRLGGPG